MSDLCLRDGITWEWFPESFDFGNGITCGKWQASPEYRTVVYETDLTLDEFVALHGPTMMADLKLSTKQRVTAGWKEYQARWIPGTCPQENHVVHLTWLVTTHRLPEFAYNRIRDLIEYGAEPEHSHLYNSEPGKHFSKIRPYVAKPTRGRTHAIPFA
jgi:hypothetical protein